VDPQWTNDVPLSSPGDVWQLGHHRLLCGDARNADDLARLLGQARAAMAFLDPPYNVRVRDIVGRGQIKHSEFAMASGELSRTSFVEFLQQSLAAATAVSRDGAIHFVCMDWRHLGELLEAGGAVYDAMVNLVVWAKTNAGQGSFYRSAHELIGVFRVGQAAHLNNVELGRHGRSRTNVWHYAGVNTFRAGRLDELQCHPTVKPVVLVADAIKDCTGRGDIVLDTFCGSGTTILAAERVGRRAYTLEIEPRFVDVAIKRWQAFSRKDAIHADSGLSFDELASNRAEAASPDLATTAVR
jgi:DNA modification methylase